MKKLKNHKDKGASRFFTIILSVLFFLTVVAISIIYIATYSDKSTLLKNLCQNQTEVIKSIYKENNDENYILKVLKDQSEKTKRLGNIVEFDIGYLKNDSINILLRTKHGIQANYKSVPLKSNIAIPLKYALSQKTGLIKGLDNEGNEVLAYCTYIPELKWGIVTKMDISDVYLSIYKKSIIALVFLIILIIITFNIFRRVSRTIREKIEKSEEKYHRLFEYSAIPIWRIDASKIKNYFDKLKLSGVTDFRSYFKANKDEVGRLASLIKVVEINQKSLELFGAEKKEDVITNMLFYFNEKSYIAFREELITLAEGGKRFECEMPQRTLTGDVKILFQILSVVKGYEDTLSNVLISFIDITELKNYEDKLMRARIEWIKTFDLIPDMITILDNQFNIVRANKATTDRLGILQDEIIGLHCYQCIHGMKEPPSFCPHAMMLKDGKEHIADFYEERLGVDLLVSVTPIYDDDGNIKGSVHIARDITEHKKFENELKRKNAELMETNATKDKFFSIIAHDMKNPFISLLGASELLYANAYKYDSEKIAKFTKILNDSAKSGYDMLINLLEWSRSQAGSMVFKPEKINFKELINKDHTVLIENARNKNINLNFDIANDVQVYADKNMLNTMLRNLINNALKFTKRGGNVTVSAKNENGSVIISVKDTGTGIKRSNFDKLFRTDIKYSEQGTEHEGGTGIGLLLCKEFVEKHGGKIWFESEENYGTTFYFNLKNAEN